MNWQLRKMVWSALLALSSTSALAANISAWFSSAHRAGRAAPMADHASTLFVLTLLAMLATCTHVRALDNSHRYPQLLPPVEYDHFYKGNLTVLARRSQPEMLQSGCKLSFP